MSLTLADLDHPLHPRKGYNFDTFGEIAGGPIGGGEDFYKLGMLSELYRPFYTDSFERKHVIYSKLGLSYADTYGNTDDFGYNIADADGNVLKPQPDKEKYTPGTMHIHDLNATILHLLGIDHKKLTYRYQGRDFRLTDIHGHVIKELLA